MLSCSRCSNALLPFNPSLLWHSFLMTGNLSSLHVGVSAGDNLLGISIRSVWFLSPRGKHPMGFVSKMSPHEHQQFGNAQSSVLHRNSQKWIQSWAHCLQIIISVFVDESRESSALIQVDLKALNSMQSSCTNCTQLSGEICFSSVAHVLVQCPDQQIPSNNDGWSCCGSSIMCFRLLELATQHLTSFPFSSWNIVF